MKQNKILGITITPQTKSDILEKIVKYIEDPQGFFHIVSLNPENLVIAHKNKSFIKTLETAQIRIIDGIGVVIAARLLNINIGPRLTGVDLMEEIIKVANMMRLRVLLIGGRKNLAPELVNCYNQQYSKARFKGIYGIKNIKKPSPDEEGSIVSIVTAYKPHMIFVAFGSPDQELWLDRHKKELSGIVVMGVGGAFDYLGGRIRRAPKLIQKLGLEWFYRLVSQPWRWRRQLRLLKFIQLVIKEKWRKN